MMRLVGGLLKVGIVNRDAVGQMWNRSHDGTLFVGPDIFGNGFQISYQLSNDEDKDVKVSSF